MKKTIILSLVVVFATLFCTNVNAQFSFIKDKLKDKSNKTTDSVKNKVSAQADSLGSKLVSGVTSFLKGKDKIVPANCDTLTKICTCPVDYKLDSLTNKCLLLPKKDRKKKDKDDNDGKDDKNKK